MDKDTLYAIFKTAIDNEYASYEFYRKAAADTTDKKAKELFERFMATELDHKTELEKLYKSLREQNG